MLVGRLGVPVFEPGRLYRQPARLFRAMTAESTACPALSSQGGYIDSLPGSARLSGAGEAYICSALRAKSGAEASFLTKILRARVDHLVSLCFCWAISCLTILKCHQNINSIKIVQSYCSIRIQLSSSSLCRCVCLHLSQGSLGREAGGATSRGR